MLNGTVLYPAVLHGTPWYSMVLHGPICSCTPRHSMARCAVREPRELPGTLRKYRSRDLGTDRRQGEPGPGPAPRALRAASCRLHAALACCILRAMLHHRVGGCVLHDSVVRRTCCEGAMSRPAHAPVPTAPESTLSSPHQSSTASLCRSMHSWPLPVSARYSSLSHRLFLVFRTSYSEIARAYAPRHRLGHAAGLVPPVLPLVRRHGRHAGRHLGVPARA